MDILNNTSAAKEMRISRFLTALEENMESLDYDKSLTGAILASTESDDAEAFALLHDARSDFDSVLAATISSLESEGIADEYTDLQRAVGAATAILASDPRAALEAEVAVPVSSGEFHHVVNNLSNGMTNRQHSLEHYDDREMQALRAKSVTYNMEAVKPTDFVKTIFPFVVFNPGSSGVKVKIELMYRQDDVRRSLSGDLANFNRVNLTHAAIDSSILRDDSTRVIPAYNANTADKFVDTAVIPNWTPLNEGVSVPTNFIKFGQKVDLIALSQTATLLSKGVMDQTDQLDVRNSIEKLAYQIGADIIELNVLPIASSAFSSGQPGVGTNQILNFNTVSITFDANSTARGDTAFTEADLLAIAANNLVVQMELALSGSVDVDTGRQVVYPTEFSVYKVFDSTGVELDKTDAVVAPIVARLESAIPLGYTPLSYRSNMNRRQRGRTIGSSTYTEEYYTPLRSPLSTLRPVGSNKETKDVAILVAATHIEMANEAVQTLADSAAALAEYTTNSNVTLDRPDYLGIGRFYVNPRYVERKLDLPLQINSLSSSNRLNDIRAVLVMQIRDIAARLYLESGFSAAQSVVHPGSSRKPLVILATDTYTASHLNESNGERLLGDQFDHVVVTNDNKDMRGKIYILLSDQTETDGINPLSAGNTLYAPELLSNLVIDRNGQTSKEVTVMRHYRMLMNVNVMGLVHVSGLADVLGQICECDGNGGGGVNPNSDPYLGITTGSGSNLGNYW